MVSQSRFSSYFSYYKVNLIPLYEDEPLYSFLVNCLFMSFVLFSIHFFLTLIFKSSFYIRILLYSC